MTVEPQGPSEQPQPQTPAGESRRDFLGKTIALAATATALSACASAGKRTPTAKERLGPIGEPAEPMIAGPDETIRIAVLGTGGMGTGHCNSFISLNESGRCNVQVVALADVNRIRLESAQKQCQDRQGIQVDAYGDYRRVLERQDIHGVLIASPEHWHAPMAVDAMRAGKDVYVEKPMTLRLDEALRLRQFVLANPQLIFQVGTQKMILPKWIEARRIIAEGGIGKPVFSQTSYCRNSKDGEWLYYHIDPEVVPGPNLNWAAWLGHLGPREFDGAVYAQWRRYKDFSTGIVGDLLVHQMTPLMMALDAGWPTRVTASGGHYVDKAMENHDQVNMNIEFEAGHTMIVAGSTCNDVGLPTIIRGHEATMELNSPNVVIRPQRHWVDEIEERTVPCDDIGNDQDALRANWLECMRSRQPAVSGIDLATKMMVAVDLATRSMWEGCAFAFDPATMTARRI